MIEAFDRIRLHAKRIEVERKAEAYDELCSLLEKAGQLNAELNRELAEANTAANRLVKQMGEERDALHVKCRKLECISSDLNKANDFLRKDIEKREQTIKDMRDRSEALAFKLDDRDRTIKAMQERFGAEVASRMAANDPIPLIPPGPTIAAGRADEIEEQYKSFAHRLSKVEGVINSWWKAGGFTPPNLGD